VHHSVVGGPAARTSLVFRLYPSRLTTLNNCGPPQPTLFVDRAVAAFRAASESVHASLEGLEGEKTTNVGRKRIRKELTLRFVWPKEDKFEEEVELVCVNANGTLANLRNSLKDKPSLEWVYRTRQTLTGKAVKFVDNFQRLNPSTPLSAFNFSEAEELLVPRRSFQVFIKKLTGKTITVEVTIADTIQMIRARYGLPYRLSFCGPLSPLQTVGELKISRESTIHEYIPLRGD